MKDILEEYGQTAAIVIIGLSMIKILWAVMQALSY